MTFRVVNALWCLVFAWSAVVQLNDPDPVRWASIYTAAAGIAAVAAAGRPVPRWASGTVIATAAVWALGIAVTTRDVGPAMDHGPGGFLAFEVVREVLGLGLVAGWMAVLVARPGPASAPASSGAPE